MIPIGLCLFKASWLGQRAARLGCRSSQPLPAEQEKADDKAGNNEPKKQFDTRDNASGPGHAG